MLDSCLVMTSLRKGNSAYFSNSPSYLFFPFIRPTGSRVLYSKVKQFKWSIR